MIFLEFSNIGFTYLTVMISFFKDQSEKWLVPTFYDLITKLLIYIIVLSQHNNYLTQIIGPLKF